MSDAETRKKPYRFEVWQATLITLVIAAVVEYLLLRLTPLRPSSVFVVSLLVGILMMVLLDNPYSRYFAAVFNLLVVVVLVAAFGTETYCFIMRLQ